jgi:hypothetical protein
MTSSKFRILGRQLAAGVSPTLEPGILPGGMNLRHILLRKVLTPLTITWTADVTL